MPDGVKAGDKLPAIVCCHGFGGTENFIVGDFTRFFVQRGFAALTFDYRRFGICEVPKYRLILPEQCRDLGNAITLMESLDYVYRDCIGLYGKSADGGGVSVAGTDKCLKATVASVGYGNGGRWLSSIRRVTTGEYEWVTPSDIMTRDT